MIKTELLLKASIGATFLFIAVVPNSQADPSPSGKTTQLRAVPIQNYWDANSWDRSGASLFWHAVRDDRRSTSSQPGKNVRRTQAEENSASRNNSGQKRHRYGANS